MSRPLSLRLFLKAKELEALAGQWGRRSGSGITLHAANLCTEAATLLRRASDHQRKRDDKATARRGKPG